MVAVGLVVTASVTFGGMRSMTFVQAFQYWLKLTALAVPALVLLAVFVFGPDRDGDAAAAGVHRRHERRREHPGHPAGRGAGRHRGARRGGRRDRQRAGVWAPGLHTVDAGTTLRFPAGAAVPVVTDADRRRGPGPRR